MRQCHADYEGDLDDDDDDDGHEDRSSNDEGRINIVERNSRIASLE
jgi:hypothetical protein